MSSRVIKIDTKNLPNLTKVIEWLERNIGPVINSSLIAEGLDDMPEGAHWKLKHKITTPKGQRVATGLFCEFDDTVDGDIILYFALRFA
jgi:hypothetical protein